MASLPLVLSEEQRLLQSGAETLFAERAPVAALRALRDNADADGFCRELWRDMAGLGWVGCFLPEAFGGTDGSFSDFGVIMQAAGRTLVASPLFATVALGASAILLGGSAEQHKTLLPRIASGELLLSLALEEGPHHRPRHIATTLTGHGDGHRLNGRKVQVADGHVADKLIVVARSSGAVDDAAGITLCIVERDAPGVTVARRPMVDSRNMAELHFDNVPVATTDLLGEPGAGDALLRQVLDRGNAALAAEMLGSALAAFERTLGYLKQREQFGVPIGSFQALQHRAAQLFCELELSKSAVLAALHAADEGGDALPLMASLAKLQVCETLRRVTDEGIQMHGGIGVTDEEDIGLYLKRARVAQQLLGDEHYHVQRYAALRGY